MRRRAALLLATVSALSLAPLAGSTASTAKLRIRPLLVLRGSAITITGTGFRPSLRVALRIGRPNTDNTARLGTVRAGAAGGFRFRKTISRSTPAGPWVVLACQRTCRIKATAQFRVAKIKPV